MTKIKKKKLLWIIPAAVVVVAAAATVLFLLFSQKEPTQTATLLDVSSYDNVTNSVLQVSNPEAQSETPLPFSRYPVTAPEGYQQLLNAADCANRYSTSYMDVFYRDGLLVTLTQSYALDQKQIPLQCYAHLEEVEIGGRRVLCYTEEDDDYSGAVWLEGDHVMELLVYGTMERDDLLAWVAGVDFQNPVLPEVCPLKFVPGYRVQTGTTPEGYPDWKTRFSVIGGNPDPADPPTQRTFAQAPEGFTLQREVEDEWNHQYFGWEYQDAQGNLLSLTNWKVSAHNTVLIRGYWLSNGEQESDILRPVTVDGREGRLYSRQDSSELTWLEEDYIVHLTYLGTATPEQMLAWGEETVLDQAQAQ